MPLSCNVVHGKLYAHGSMRVVPSKIYLYGMVECKNDLSGVDCKKCIDVARSELLGHSYKMKVGRAIYGSCNNRNITPFTT
ncbi:hypothetical protein PRUPE_3G131600 [Prunus persica]|uniref:Uncharacterized protein n=1 Tax=Prunus persica TaxID=3760 RepID=M5VZS5_PRUPE|nr:hypothetical protein PRUPE_3G131600 [Prunus persica]